MKKSISTLFAIALLALSGCAKAEQPVQQVEARPAIWALKDADTTIYLFGTIHLLRPEIRWFDGQVKQAFDSADELVLEMIEPSAQDMTQLFLKLALNPEGPTTTSLLAPKDRERYIATAEQMKMPWQGLDKFDPWMVAVNLSLAPLVNAGYDPNSGADHALVDAAKAKGKRIFGLETAEQQLGYFDALPRELQVRYLNSTVEEIPDTPRQFDRLLQNWGKGDAHAIARDMNSSLDKTPELAEVLLYRRNAHWAGWIAKRMDRPGTVFVAVGAGHLAGPRSVQDDLAHLGYKVERIGAH
jgi:uncharacterized protein YbaP (TraB family)